MFAKFIKSSLIFHFVLKYAYEKSPYRRTNRPN